MRGENETYLRILGIRMPPHSDLVGYDGNGEPILSGTGFKTIQVVLSSLGIKYTTKFVNGFTGVPLGNGSWTGVVGVLQRDEADVSMACQIPNFERLKIIDLSVITAQADSFIYGSVGPAENTDIRAIVKIFSLMVWFCIISSMLLLATVHGLTVKNQEGGFGIRFVERREFFKIHSDYIAALFFEGTPRDPTTSRGRFLYGIWWLALLVLVNGFCGHTRAMMMAPKEGFKVLDLEHLLTVSDRITPMALRDSIFELFFRGGSQTEKKIFKSMMLVGTIPEIFSMEKLMALKEGKGVILFESVIAKNMLGLQCSQAKLNVYSSKKPFLSSYCYMFFRKEMDQSIRKSIDQRIRWLFEADLINKWIEIECRLFERCRAASVQAESENALTVKDMSSLFVLICACLGASTIYLVFEILVYIYSKSRHHRL